MDNNEIIKQIDDFTKNILNPAFDNFIMSFNLNDARINERWNETKEIFEESQYFAILEPLYSLEFNNSKIAIYIEQDNLTTRISLYNGDKIIMTSGCDKNILSYTLKEFINCLKSLIKTF